MTDKASTSNETEPRAGTEPSGGTNPPGGAQPGGDTPTKKLVIEFLEGDWYEGDTFEDLVADILPGYEEEEAATQWHMRRQWARAMSARMQALFEADVSLDWTSAQSLIETAAQGRVCVLYDNLGAETS